jgi:predicted dehydrogenase
MDRVLYDAARYRVAIVGCGYWGAKHLRVLRQLPNVGEIYAVDTDTERRESLIRNFPNVRGVGEIEDALDVCDAVVIATPPSTHAKLALRAIEAGRHVLVEKPMTVYEDEADLLIEAAAEEDVTLMVGHTFEFNAAVRYLREQVQAGEFGQLYYLDSARLNLGLYRHDVNVVWDLAPHDVSIANYLLDSQPTSVQAWGRSHAYTAQEDVAYLRLNYEELGVTAQIHVSWLDPCKVRRVTVVGSKRMAVYDDMAQDERVRMYDKGVTTSEGADPGVPMSYRYGGITSPYIPFEEPLLVQNRHFLDCIDSGEKPFVDGEKGLAVVRVLQAAEDALRSGREVEVSKSSSIDRRPLLAVANAS